MRRGRPAIPAARAATAITASRNSHRRWTAGFAAGCHPFAPLTSQLALTFYGKHLNLRRSRVLHANGHCVSLADRAADRVRLRAWLGDNGYPGLYARQA